MTFRQTMQLTGYATSCLLSGCFICYMTAIGNWFALAGFIPLCLAMRELDRTALEIDEARAERRRTLNASRRVT